MLISFPPLLRLFSLLPSLLPGSLAELVWRETKAELAAAAVALAGLALGGGVDVRGGGVCALAAALAVGLCLGLGVCDDGDGVCALGGGDGDGVCGVPLVVVLALAAPLDLV